MAMTPRTTDFSALSKLAFEYEPVGVKFEYFRPQGIEALDTPLAMCEMPREAQKREAPFYMDRSNENCMGKGAMGMMGDEPSWAAAGLIGERMGIFRDASANRNCMTHYTVMHPGSVNYIVFSKLSVMDFEPDLVVFTGEIDTIGTIMRAMSYATGEVFESKATPVFQCSWMFSYPVTSNKVNYIPLGTGHGTTARRCYQKNELICSVPRPWFPTILESLKEMPLVPEAWEMSREEWLEAEEGIYGKIISDAQEAGWA